MTEEESRTRLLQTLRQRVDHTRVTRYTQQPLCINTPRNCRLFVQWPANRLYTRSRACTSGRGTAPLLDDRSPSTSGARLLTRGSYEPVAERSGWSCAM